MIRLLQLPSILLVVAILTCESAFGQAKLVMDINTKLAGLLEDNEVGSLFTRSGNYLYFCDGRLGNNGLWKTDGTASGTQKVVAISQKYGANYSPDDFIDLGGKLFFPAYDADHGQELWYTDGTSAGTSLLDITPGKGGSNPSGTRALGAKLYFFVNDDQYTKYELWQSDGTLNGTSVVKDFPLQNGILFPVTTAVAGSYFYFTQTDNNNNVSLWSSDGTSSGTTLLHTFPTGAYLGNMASVGEKLFLSAYGTGTNNQGQLWVSDGTVAGTSSVVDISYPGAFYAYNNKLVFAGGGNNIYISDGTSEGTTLLYYASIYGAGVLNDKLYILGQDQLIVTDGTPAGTESIVQLVSNGDYLTFYGTMPVVDGKLIVEVESDATGKEIGISDGTAEGTQLLKDILPGSGSGTVRAQALIDGKVVFVADDGVHGLELWVTDGTADGTVFLKDVLPGTQDSRPSRVASLANNLYYVASSSVESSSELWFTHSSDMSTQKVPGSLSGYFFIAGTSTDLYYKSYSTLQRMNSTTGTLTQVQDLSNISSSSTEEGYTFGNSVLFPFAPTFRDGTPNTGREIWKADVTGLSLLKDINPGSAAGIPYTRGFVTGGKFLFAATDGVRGSELWLSDGTTGGTALLADINPGSGDSSPDYYTDVNGTIFFSADDGVHGRELWKTDGTTAGTALVKDILAGTDGSGPMFPTTLGSAVYFTAYDATNGWALWKSDGTDAGTVMVKDIYPGNDVNYYPSDMIAINGSLFFSCDDGQHGEELWVSDGTADGTKMIEIVPGAAGGAPTMFMNANQWACFSANNQIWVSDGVTAKMVTDNAPFEEMVYFNQAIYFPSTSDDYGNELFYVPFTDAPPAVVTTGIEDSEYAINIYPNPSSQQIRFSVNGIEGEADVEILDMNGRVMDKISLENHNEVKYSLANYPTAIYIARIVTNKGIAYRRIVKI